MSPRTRGKTSRISALAKLSVISPPGPAVATGGDGSLPITLPLPGRICARGTGTTGVGFATAGSARRAGDDEAGPVLLAAAPAALGSVSGFEPCRTVHAESASVRISACQRV